MVKFYQASKNYKSRWELSFNHLLVLARLPTSTPTPTPPPRPVIAPTPSPATTPSFAEQFESFHIELAAIRRSCFAHSLFCMCHKLNKQVENATILLLLAEIHERSGNVVLGIPCALASLSFCQSFNLDLLKASATLTLAELRLSLGSNHAKRASTLVRSASLGSNHAKRASTLVRSHCQSFNLDLLKASTTLTLAELRLSLGSNHAKRASTLVHRSLPMIRSHGGLELRARAAFIVEAKCYLSDPT
ncbi:hypothetical protein RHGRI_033122 [Rhododendron griersonianum]|uniref:Uncharacterized protein n=1 Tax=Rhododendron griersonianum TaxID=479676 RepID=A0AAV6HW10_9ERIC|nr:hypothetical protein RHGRI_033122 [Rhododendron griersonianum]